MKTTAILAIAAALALSPMATAQNNRQQKADRPTKEEMIQMQSTKMAQQLGLSDEQSAKFVELYSAFKSEIREVNKSKVKVTPELSDAELDAALLSNFKVSRQILEIREAYFPKFRAIMSARQTQKMYMLENERGMSHSGMQPGGARPGMPDQMHGRRDDMNGRREAYPQRYMNPQ